jgi:hypothetical protein
MDMCNEIDTPESVQSMVTEMEVSNREQGVIQRMLTRYAALLEVVNRPVGDEEVEACRDVVVEALGNALDCTRVWSAWGCGTMTEDDFTPVVDSSERIAEITRAALESHMSDLRKVTK